MSSTNIQLKLRQTQQLSQNMQQSLRVLQMSGIEIEREVEDWLADNPLLDRVEQPEKTYEPPQTTVDIAKRGVSLDDDDSSAWENLAQEETLNSYLHKQVAEHRRALNLRRFWGNRCACLQIALSLGAWRRGWRRNRRARLCRASGFACRH